MILIAPFWQVYVSAKNCLWISLVWMQPGKISVWMMSQCNKKKFVVCDGSDNFLRWLFLDLRWSCMTVGPLTIWSNYRPKMTDYPSFLHSSSTRLEFTPQKKCSEILHTKNWHYKSLQKSNLVHNSNFYPNSNFQNQNNFSWLHSNKWNSQAIFALT